MFIYLIYLNRLVNLKKFIWFLILFLIIGFVSASGVTFNVYQETGVDYNLTGVNVDCNSGVTYDLTN